MGRPALDVEPLVIGGLVVLAVWLLGTHLGEWRHPDAAAARTLGALRTSLEMYRSHGLTGPAIDALPFLAEARSARPYSASAALDSGRALRVRPRRAGI